MLSHAQPIEVARSAIDHITGRTEDEQQPPVANCPGWTVYDAAAHIADDLHEYDRVMVEDGHTAVLVSPDPILGNAPSA